MSMAKIGWMALAAGVVVNNLAYLSDLWIRDAPCIWLGPKSAVLIVVALAAIVVGAWLTRRGGTAR